MLSPELVVSVVGAVTVVLALAFGVPQWLRVRRTGSVSGISLPSIVNSLVSTTAWLLYGLHLHDVWITATSVAGLPALVVTATAVLRLGGSRSGLWIPAAWAAVLVTAALLGPVLPTAFPTVLGASVLWYVTPAASTAWRSADVSGVASGTWMLLALDGGLAGAYGVLAEVPASIVYAAVASLGAVVVLARLWWPWAPACGECAPVTGCECPA